jgi:hypothetical protein
MRGLHWFIFALIVGGLLSATLLLARKSAPLKTPSSARFDELLKVAESQGRDWHADAQLVSVRILPRGDGSIDLTQTAPAAEFIFFSPKANDAVGIMFAKGVARIDEYVASSDHEPLPEKFMPIEEALKHADQDGWRQTVRRALLSYHAKEKYKPRFVWILVGDGSVPDDRVYCIDAVSAEPILAMEIEEFLETPKPATKPAWLTTGPARAVSAGEGRFMWQMIATPEHYLLPVRPLNDRERVQPDTAPLGPFQPLTTEQKRVFRAVFADRVQQIDTEPGIALKE